MSTYTPLATLTTGSSTSTVTFASIPQTYTDLFLSCNFAPSSGADIYLQFNADTNSTFYSVQQAWTNNGTAGARARNSGNSDPGIQPRTIINQPTTITTIWNVNIMNYSSSNTNKTTIGRYGITGSLTEMDLGTWAQTAPITSLTVVAYGNTFTANSVFTLYGISASNAVAPKATGGNQVYSDGTYWYHTFTSSGTLTTTQSISNVDYLVVAGGGGAACTGGVYTGGGGAGGLRCTVGATGGGGSLESKITLSSNASYTVTVGAGGAGGINYGSQNGVDGSSSSIAGTGITTITSVGGGASTGGGAGNTGGSGGGGAGTGGAGGSGTANQGYAGGAGAGGGVAGAGGGGGGAGGAGTAGNAGTNTGGNGGAGITTSISGTSLSYAGGGGASSNAAGGTASAGGGAGKVNGTANSGTANTGGGGGSTNNADGGNGGSGIVIVRYAV